MPAGTGGKRIISELVFANNCSFSLVHKKTSVRIERSPANVKPDLVTFLLYESGAECLRLQANRNMI